MEQIIDEIKVLIDSGQLEELVIYLYKQHPKALYTDTCLFSLKCLNFVRDF